MRLQGGALLCGTLENEIENTSLKHLAINIPLFNSDRILRSIHRIILLRIALKMNLRDQRLIPGTDRHQMKMRAAPELRGARGIRPVRNRPNAFDFVLTSLRRNQSPAITKVQSRNPQHRIGVSC